MTTTTISSVTKKTLNRQQLIKALNLPENVEIYVHVPGCSQLNGGDWANKILHIGNGTDLTVRYEETKTLKT